MGAFHAYDIRGIYNVDFDKDTAYKVGYFLPELLGADKVLVGRDCRVSSDEIHDYLVKGITDAGADVYDLGLSTTPMVYFGTASYGFKASVQYTQTIGNVDITLSAVHYRNELQSAQTVNTLLADAGVVWRLKKVRLQAELRNIFNRRNYAVTYYGSAQALDNHDTHA